MYLIILHLQMTQSVHLILVSNIVQTKKETNNLQSSVSHSVLKIANFRNYYAIKFNIEIIENIVL